MQNFEQFASSLLKQMKQTFTFKSSGFPGVTIFNYESEAAMEAIEFNWQEQDKMVQDDWTTDNPFITAFCKNRCRAYIASF